MSDKPLKHFADLTTAEKFAALETLDKTATIVLRELGIKRPGLAIIVQHATTIHYIADGYMLATGILDVAHDIGNDMSGQPKLAGIDMDGVR